MKWKLVQLALVLCASCVLGTSAGAFPITLSLVPTSLALSPTQELYVSVVVSGLEDAEEQQVALESFDLDLSFDTSRLSFDSIVFGGSLGNPGDSLETYLILPASPNASGVVSFGEFSWLDEETLLASQDGTFTLATIKFIALANAGPAALALINLCNLQGQCDEAALGGFGGSGLGDELTPPSPIEVEIVPEPATAALVVTVLAWLGHRRMRG